MKSPFALALTFALISTCPPPVSGQQPADSVPDYIRFRQPGNSEQPDVLETAATRFQRGNHVVDLIAIVHLGDSDYYKKISDSLKIYDAVYYEMVGGPYTEEKARRSREAASDSTLAQLQGIQQMAKKILGLEFQLDQLDYLSPNFVHADMTEEEFSKRGSGGLDLSNMLARAMEIAQSGELKGLPKTEEEANRMMSLLFGAIMSGDSNQLKRSLAPILSEAESFISQLEGDEGSVLISQRNQIVMDVISKTSQTRTGGRAYKDAVLYGAGHMPDLEKRLLNLGYLKSNTVWTPSWTIPQGAAINKNPPSLPDLLKHLGGIMEMMKKAGQ